MQSVCGNYINNDSNRSKDYYFSRLKMTREQYYPSMLIECGFVSNPEEHEQLIKPENQQKIAEQMVKGLINYFVKTGSLNHAELETPKDESGSSQPSVDTSKPSDSSSVPSSEIASSEIAASETATNDTVAYLEPKRQLV